MGCEMNCSSKGRVCLCGPPQDKNGAKIDTRPADQRPTPAKPGDKRGGN